MLSLTAVGQKWKLQLNFEANKKTKSIVFKTKWLLVTFERKPYVSKILNKKNKEYFFDLIYAWFPGITKNKLTSNILANK